MENNKIDLPRVTMQQTPDGAIAYAYYTCIGGRDEDQDSLGVTTIGKRHIFTVCDGMGGHAGGRIASETAVKALFESLEQKGQKMSIPRAMEQAVKDANAAVYSKAAKEKELRGMGTTVTLLVIDSHAAYTAYVGDSRIYHFRNKQKIYRTFDESGVFQLVEKNIITEEQARVHPRSNVLLRALGTKPDIDVKVTEHKCKAGDKFVLCCDGVWNSQPEPEIINLFFAHDELQEAVDNIMQKVEEIGQTAGGHHDNHTLIFVDVMSRPQTGVRAWAKRLSDKLFCKKPSVQQPEVIKEEKEILKKQENPVLEEALADAEVATAAEVPISESATTSEMPEEAKNDNN